MREIKVGGKEIRIRATPLALFYYRQEFKKELLSDMLGMVRGLNLKDISELNTDDTDAMLKVVSSLDILAILQIIWAMAKADGFGTSFPSFEKWLGELENIDLSDPSFLVAAMEEAAHGFLGEAGAGTGK